MAYAQENRIPLLKNEHRQIRRRIESFRNAIAGHPLPSSGELRVSIGRLGSLVESHLYEEETGVYRQLRRRLGRDNPIDQMAREHKLIRRTFDSLLSLSSEYEADPSRIVDVRSCLDSLQREVGAHFEKEETVLFWLADLKL